jgi:hypothetical protein
MRILLFVMALLFFNPPAGKHNGKIDTLTSGYVSFSTKEGRSQISRDHIFYKNPKEGDSVWVTPGPAAPNIYRDSRLIKEVDSTQ